MDEIYDKVFCEGTWSHKYNESRNERMADEIGEPNDRTSADVGEEPKHADYSHIPDSGSNEPF